MSRMSGPMLPPTNGGSTVPIGPDYITEPADAEQQHEDES